MKKYIISNDEPLEKSNHNILNTFEPLNNDLEKKKKEI